MKKPKKYNLKRFHVLRYGDKLLIIDVVYDYIGTMHLEKDGFYKVNWNLYADIFQRDTIGEIVEKLAELYPWKIRVMLDHIYDGFYVKENKGKFSKDVYPHHTELRFAEGCCHNVYLPFDKQEYDHDNYHPFVRQVWYEPVDGMLYKIWEASDEYLQEIKDDYKKIVGEEE